MGRQGHLDRPALGDMGEVWDGGRLPEVVGGVRWDGLLRGVVGGPGRVDARRVCTGRRVVSRTRDGPATGVPRSCDRAERSLGPESVVVAMMW
jgi:hypothetical protein